jgi:hypothetical protein
MGLEASDVNDGAILGSTERRQNDKGQVQLAVMLPVGRELTSEWIAPDSLNSSVMLAWCESVRGQIEFDANEQELAAKRAWQMKKRDEEMGILDYRGDSGTPPDAIGGPIGGSGSPPTLPPSLPATDPLSYARQELERAARLAAKLDGQLEDMRVHLKMVRAAALGWDIIVKNLEAAA